jgi:hypothetical protein
MSLYKRLLSTSTVAIGIALLTVVQICYNFQSIQYHSKGSSNGAELLAEFTAIDITYETGRFSPSEQRRTTIENEEPFHQTAIHIAEKEPQIKLLLSPQELSWVKQRGKLFAGWYNKTALTIRHNSYPILKRMVFSPTNTSTLVNGRNQPIPADFVAYTLDSSMSISKATPESHPMMTHSVRRETKSSYVDKNGPWLDFVIIGNP